MGRRRLRERLDHLESEASDTMTDAQRLLAVAQAFVEEIQDGVDVKIEKIKGASIQDFISGKTEVFPFKIRLEFVEQEDANG